MSTVVDDVHAANGLFLAIYTNNYKATPTQSAYDGFRGYFEPDMVTGSLGVPPCNISFVPFTMVVDLDTMTVIGRDTMFSQMTPQQILTLVQQTNE